MTTKMNSKMREALHDAFYDARCEDKIKSAPVELAWSDLKLLVRQHVEASVPPEIAAIMSDPVMAEHWMAMTSDVYLGDHCYSFDFRVPCGVDFEGLPADCALSKAAKIYTAESERFDNAAELFLDGIKKAKTVDELLTGFPTMQPLIDKAVSASKVTAVTQPPVDPFTGLGVTFE